MGGLKQLLSNKPYLRYLSRSMVLPALSLIEVIVASVIFLVVLTVSLHTVVSLTIKQTDDSIYIVADMAAKETCVKYTLGDIDEPEYVKEYSWGKIVAQIDAYDNYFGIEELTVKAQLLYGRREIVYKYLIERRDQ